MLAPRTNSYLHLTLVSDSCFLGLVPKPPRQVEKEEEDDERVPHARCPAPVPWPVSVRRYEHERSTLHVPPQRHALDGHVANVANVADAGYQPACPAADAAAPVTGPVAGTGPVDAHVDGRTRQRRVHAQQQYGRVGVERQFHVLVAVWRDQFYVPVSAW